MNTKLLSFSIIVIILLQSCKGAFPQTYFIPQEGNGLRLEKKKDLKVSGGVMIKTNKFPLYNKSNIFQKTQKSIDRISSFQIAYSPLNHLGIFGMHSRSRNNNPENSSFNFHKSHLTGGGIGTYFSYKGIKRPANKLKWEKITKYNNFILDLYGGYVFGKLENHFLIPVANTKMNFQKFYLQGGIHWTAQKITLAMFYKTGFTNYDQGIINGSPNVLYDVPIRAILKKENILFQELSFKIDYKIKNVLLYGQVSISSIEKFENLGITNLPLFGGLIINIHHLRKKEKL